MAGSYSRTVLVGNLGADAESRTSQGGTVVTNLRVATSEREKKGDEWSEVTEWHKVVVFGKPAEFAARLKKGERVLVEGRNKTRKWTDKEGHDHYTTEVVAFVLIGLTARSSEAGPGPADDETPF